jgi:hypothetical protein
MGYLEWHAYILYRPIWSNECEEIGELRYAQSKITFGAHSPLVRKVCAVLSDDWEARPVADIKPCCAHNCVYLALDAILANDSVLGDLVYCREVDVHVWFLDGGHIRISGRNSSTANTPLGRKSVEESLVFYEFSHASFHHLLAYGLCLGVFVEHSPEAVDLVLDALGVLDELCRIFVKCRPLFIRVLVVRSVVIGNLYKPYWSPNEHIKMLGVRLHVWYGLNRRCS